ncbi:rhomboid family intramembrane serine protease [Meiothermus phage MMP7]|nr:rhomboid family intramembrane serine protease [Meiothermus phage MMP7]
MRAIRFFVVFALALWGLGLAQDTGSISTDISQWFASTASLAAVVAALMALVRKHILKGLDGLAVVGVSLVLGVGLAFLGKTLGYLGGDWLLFGLSAGLMASGGVDLLRSVTRGGNAPSGDTSTDASRARLR